MVGSVKYHGSGQRGLMMLTHIWLSDALDLRSRLSQALRALDECEFNSP